MPISPAALILFETFTTLRILASMEKISIEKIRNFTKSSSCQNTRFYFSVFVRVIYHKICRDFPGLQSIQVFPESVKMENRKKTYIT